MYISRLHKLAGRREEKKVSGLNFSELQKKLLSQGSTAEPSTIKEMLLEEANLSISRRKSELIGKLELSEDSRRRVNEVEAALIIIGAVLKDEYKAEEFIDNFNWYLTTLELSPGSFRVSAESISSPSSIMDEFEKIYKIVLDEKEAADAKAEESKEELYISDEKVKDLSDGWKVVYVPAVGENGMPEYPGLPRTSHDRILEGNKNGLCLGSNLKYYQDNSEGKIYSVRDLSNKPRVTIRILKNVLKEAKGKGNLPPDVEGAKKADEWFKAIKGLKYKDSRDYMNFPPLTIEIAKEEFKRDEILAYEKEWVPYWYKKGIEELDLDLEKKIKENNIILLEKNFGKYQLLFEKIKPVVAYWCNEYILNKDYSLKNILFSDSNQICKTYKKLKEMQLAVNKLAEDNPFEFLQSNIKDIQEYKPSIEVAEKNYPEKDSIKFLREESDKTSKKDYIDIAAKNAAESDSFNFLRYFHEKTWAQPYIDLAEKNAAENDSYKFLHNFKDKPWAQHYLDKAAELAAEKESYGFLRYFGDKPWAQPYLDKAAKLVAESHSKAFLYSFHDKPWAEPYIDLAVKLAAESDSYDFLRNFEDKPWAKHYINLAANIAAESDSFKFLKSFNRRSFAKPYIDKAANLAAENNSFYFLVNFHEKPWAQPYLDKAAKSAAEKDSSNFLRSFSDKPWAEPHIDLAAKSAAEERSFIFLRDFSDKPWAQHYIDGAAKLIIEMIIKIRNWPSLDRFIRIFSKKPWANKPIESIGGMTWIQYAKSMKKKSGNNYKDSLIKLSNILIKMNLEKFSLAVKKLL